MTAIAKKEFFCGGCSLQFKSKVIFDIHLSLVNNMSRAQNKNRAKEEPKFNKNKIDRLSKTEIEFEENIPNRNDKSNDNSIMVNTTIRVLQKKEIQKGFFIKHDYMTKSSKWKLLLLK